ncbi:MAG: hypothetical protein AAB740_03720, partial [Patescibacteria group bacterium]
KPDSDLTLIKVEEIVWQGKTDEKGKASFSLKFDDATFDDSWVVQDNFGNENEVTFFSKTPIDIQQSIILKFIKKIKVKIPPGSPPKSVRIGLAVFGLAIAAIITFLFRKRYSKKEN